MTDFPIDTVIFNKIVEVFNQTRSYVLLLFPLAFFIRIVFGFILLKGDSFTDILKDSLFLFLGLFFFTDILKMTLQIPYFVSQELSFGEWRHINLGDGIFTKAIKRIVDWIGILSYWISFGLYVVIISILGFLAGYILFLGTMFRAYGMLKVFFLLLFVVSLWPLLWHSINFAVFTIAVSDNAFANNVIVGGASLAKVMLPLWLISKTSKIPISQNLQKMSWTGGSLAYYGGSNAYSFLKDKTVFNRKEVSKAEDEESIRAEAKINITQTETEIESSNIDFPYPAKTYIEEPEDFSLRTEESEVTQYKDQEALNQENNRSDIKEIETKDTLLKENHEAVKGNVIEEKQSHIKNETTNETGKEFHSDSNSQITLTDTQVTKEIKESSSVSENQIHNENILSKHESSNPEPAFSVPDDKRTSISFNEKIHKEDWIERENFLSLIKTKRRRMSYEEALNYL